MDYYQTTRRYITAERTPHSFCPVVILNKRPQRFGDWILSPSSGGRDRIHSPKRCGFFRKNKAMDNVQLQKSFISKPSSLTFKSYLNKRTYRDINCGSVIRKVNTEWNIRKGNSSDERETRVLSQHPTWNPLLLPYGMVLWPESYIAILLVHAISSVDIKGLCLSDQRRAQLSWSPDWGLCMYCTQYISDLRKNYICWIWDYRSDEYVEYYILWCDTV
jgi:hypothetical protein